MGRFFGLMVLYVALCAVGIMLLVVWAVHAAQVNFTWDGVTGAVGYRMYKDAACTGTFILQRPDIDAGRQTWSDTQIALGQRACYGVTAFGMPLPDGSPNESKKSNIVDITAILDTPTHLQVSVSPQGIARLTWNMTLNTVTATTVAIQEDLGCQGSPHYTTIATQDATVQSFTKTITVSGTYCYQIVALSSQREESTPSNGVGFQVSLPLTAPTGLQVIR